MRRWSDAIATGALLALTAFPFVVLFPQPPAFGQGAAAIVATVVILATVGTVLRAEQPGRRRILQRAALLLAVTIAALGTRILLADDITAKVPTADMLPRLFGLQGEDVDDAVLYEVWAELWLVCALLGAGALRLLRASSPARLLQKPARVFGPWDVVPRPPPPWNVGTVLLWIIGWAALLGAVLDGHQTAAFLSGATHVTGTVTDSQRHPRIQFRTAEGALVEFRQNGSVSRGKGATVPVAYFPDDPAGSARVDTFWANWSDLLGLVWVGLVLTLFPFFGLRAVFRPGRW